MVITKLIQELRGVFKTENSRFVASVGIKVSGISLGITFAIYWFLFQVIRVNYAFFRALGFPDVRDNNSFFDLVIREAIENLPALFIFHIGLFFIGSYVGWLMLRPFKIMGDYCENVLENLNYIYKVDEFSSYTLFTRFSEFFFEYLRESRRKNIIISNTIPPQYSRIHKPVLDYIFLLHFGLVLIIISLVSAIFIIENTSSVYASMVELATMTLKDQTSVSRYFSEQMFILDSIIKLTISLLIVFYTLLGLHLYSKISGASFAIFSTMRTYMKGNYSSRVHLIGYSHIREYTRKLNKYLDYMENNFCKDRSKN
jgi:hypothetical protein